MRKLALLTIFLAFAQCFVAAAPASRPTPAPGAIQLIKGFRHQRLQGIDSSVGRIWKEGGLEIQYDIGQLAGNRASSVKEADREWAIDQTVNGHPVEIVKNKNGEVFVTFPEDFANFYAKVANERELAAMLTITLTYPAAPAAK